VRCLPTAGALVVEPVVAPVAVPVAAPVVARVAALVARVAALVAALVGALALVVGAAAARADGTGVIAAGTDRAAIAAALADAIAATGGGRARIVGDAVAEARAALAAGAVPAASLARFRRVRETIDDAWRAFQRVQIDLAQSRLTAARAQAEPLVALPGGAELYADAALRLAAVLQYRRIADAPAVLALALALDPGRPITLAEFSPDVVDAVAAVRAAPAAIARVHIAARPAGAIISVDGRELGAAPLDAEIARGQHLVVARAPLHRAVVRAVTVDASAGAGASNGTAAGTAAGTAIDLVLEPDDAAARLAAGAAPGLAAPAEQALIDAALELADLDDVVVAAVTQRRGGPALAVQRCAGAPARCTAVAEIGFGDRAGLAAAAREAWRAVQGGALGGALGEPPGVLGDVRREPPPGCPLCRSPLVWTGVGAAVIGAVIVIAVTSGSKPPPILTVDGHGFGR
jgi:hypothetical protein